MLVVHSLFEGVTLEFPPTGLTLEQLRPGHGRVFPALRISLLLGLSTGLFDVLLSIPASYAMDRYEFKGKNLINTFLLTPNMVPAISLALGLLAIYPALNLLDSFWGLVLPCRSSPCPTCFVRSCPPSTRSTCRWKRRLEPWTRASASTFLGITLPLIGPGMIAGLLLSFIIGFNEFTIIIFVYGPSTLPASVWLWNMLFMYGITPQFAAAVTVMQLLSFAVLFVLVGVIGRRYLKGVVF